MIAQKRGPILWWGNSPVPATAMWTGEMDAGWLAPCRYAGGRLALHAPSRPGVGRPMFKNPHPVRQRRAITEMRCDICARPLRNRTKHLLAPGRYVEAEGRMVWAYQEPCVCSECLPLARRWCPHVQRIEKWPPPILRQWRVILTLMDTPAHSECAGQGTYDRPAIGYAKFFIPGE
jgi:hypothetical protein